MQLFYSPHISETTKVYTFDKEESRHITKVLRKQPGELIDITDGKGLLFHAKLESTGFKGCTASIISTETRAKRKGHLHLAVAPTKMNDRYEWFLEKATEIGIEEITPIHCDRSERKIVKHERLTRIIQSAMKQSLQCYLPKLNPIISFQEFIMINHSGERIIAHCDDTFKTPFKKHLVPGKDYTILIGPEGDFSVKEIESALQQNYIPVTLGNTRLRTETAAVVACHSVAFANE